MSEKEELEKLVKTSYSYADVLRKQQKAISGASLKILKEKLEAYEIETKFLNNSKSNRRKIPLEEKLVDGSNAQSSKLKKELIRSGLKEDKCEICGQLPFWNKKQLVLQLDHINGNHYDNRIENLRIICPNCHSQTETFSTKRLKTVKRCPICGKEIKRESSYCREHYTQFRNSKSGNKLRIRPPKEELYNLRLEYTTKELAKKFNVTEPTIRKWCYFYKIPSTQKEYCDLRTKQIKQTPGDVAKVGLKRVELSRRGYKR